MSNPWFRMYSEFSADPKVQMMDECNQRRLIMLFCLRCNGHVTLQDEEVTFLLRISNEDWQKTKALFITKGFINSENELTNWDKRQFASDADPTRDESKRAQRERPSSEVWRKIRTRIFSRDDYTCQYCGVRGVKLECDHVYPVALGGGHDDSNLVTACFKCNRSKRSKTLEQWRVT